MKKKTITWINWIYSFIRYSILFWKGIVINGVIQTLTVLYSDDDDKKYFVNSKYIKLLSIVWLVILINLFISTSNFIQIDSYLLNIVNYFSFLLFIVMTIFISWYSYISSHIEVESETDRLILSFYSAIRFWPSSLSLLLSVVIGIILSFHNLIFLIFLMPGLLITMSKLLMSKFHQSIEEIHDLIKEKDKEYIS